MSCSEARRELLEHFAFGEELGPRSAPHLAHIESCADCRREVGIDRQLVEQLRRALRERVDGFAPSEASWGVVHRRTGGRPVRPWSVRAAHMGGKLSAAAAAGIMLFAVATAPEARLFPGGPSPLVASAARRVVPPDKEAPGWPPANASSYVAAQVDAPFPDWRIQPQMSDEAGRRDAESPIKGRMP